MIAHVIPAKKLPRGLTSLTYLVPPRLADKIHLGSIVRIPLRRSLELGVLAGLAEKNTTHFNLKSLLGAPSDRPLFTHNQIKLFQALAVYYCVSPSLFIHFSLPKMIKSDWKNIPAPAPKPKSKRLKTPLEYFWWHTSQQRNKFYLQKIQKNTGQLLLVVPRIREIARLARELNLNESAYLPIHHKLSRQKNFETWLAAYGSQLKAVFIGTRSALFYPFNNLKTIIISDEHSLDHKQADMNPRYETSLVGQKIKKIYGAKIILSSFSPSLSAYSAFKPPPPKYEKLRLSVIDLKDEIAKKNFSFLSESLLAEIKKALAAAKTVFLLVNKKGESSALSCRDCGHQFNCPTCGLPLANTENKFICFHCNHHELIPPFCPRCSGPNFKSVGLGIEKIEKSLKSILPQTKIIRLDKNKKEPVQSAANALPSTVIIGTEFALDKINWDIVGLSAIINADQLWHHPEFNAGENAFHLIGQILTLTPKNAKIIIQTFSTHSKIIRAHAESQPAIFYAAELEVRKKLDYPPFVNLIKLSCSHKNDKHAAQEAEKIFSRIKKFAGQRLTITAPAPIVRKKIRGKFKYNIIVKINSLDDFKPIVKLIPNDWLIDIHPQTLLD